jgi:hypothetical protein
VKALSKKKRRYLKLERRKARRECVTCGKDTHHIFYQKRHWRGEALNMLRDYWYCKAEIPKNTLHRRIHSIIQDVPAPKAINAKSALDQLRTLERYEVIHENDTIERKLEVLIALFDYVEQPTAEALKKQLDVARKYYSKPP